MGSYLVIIAVLIIFFCIRRRRRTAAVAWQVLNQRKQNKENVVMKELAKQFIGEECIIYTITSNDGSIQGIIKEIDDGGMVIERNSGEREIVNLDFVTRIRQYPRKYLQRINIKRHQPRKLRQKPEYPSHFCFIIFITNWSYIFSYGSMQRI